MEWKGKFPYRDHGSITELQALWYYMMTLTAITSGLTPRYFPFPQPTSASTAPGGSEDRKWQTRGHGEWRVLLKWEAMASYTRCTYSSSRRAASSWQRGSEGGDGGESEGAEGAPWLSQAEGKAGAGEDIITRKLQIHLWVPQGPLHAHAFVLIRELCQK